MPDPFHVRFNIDVPIEEARRRFINRIENRVLTIAKSFARLGDNRGTNVLEPLIIEVETALGESHQSYVYTSDGFITVWRQRVNGDFSRCLKALEGFAKAIAQSFRGYDFQHSLNRAVSETLDDSEVDLGIAWHDEGFFSKEGAQLLDEGLVNQPLRWLADPKYPTVLVPFQKGLSHFLEGTKDPQRLGDAVTDVYESLEAMARIVTGKGTEDLSTLQEQFISKLRLTPSHKEMMKAYVEYGCSFRHAVKTGKQRSWPLEQEAENFVYMTGLFLRLAIQAEKSGS